MAHPSTGNDTPGQGPGTVTPESRNPTTPGDLPLTNPWKRIADALEQLVSEPPLYQRDWSHGAIEPQFGEAITGWIDLADCARKAQAASVRVHHIDQSKLLGGAVAILLTRCMGYFEHLETPGSEQLEPAFTTIWLRPDVSMDMFPAALTYFGADGLQVLNRVATEADDICSALQGYADTAFFDEDKGSSEDGPCETEVSKDSPTTRDPSTQSPATQNQQPTARQEGPVNGSAANAAKGIAKDADERSAATVEFARAARDAITVPIPAPEPIRTRRVRPKSIAFSAAALPMAAVWAASTLFALGLVALLALAFVRPGSLDIRTVPEIAPISPDWPTPHPTWWSTPKIGAPTDGTAQLSMPCTDPDKLAPSGLLWCDYRSHLWNVPPPTVGFNTTGAPCEAGVAQSISTDGYLIFCEASSHQWRRWG
jgi:hypothetical protein